MPADLAKAFKANPKAKTLWDGLTPIAKRDFIRWIETAKQPETRARRIKRTCEELLEGKKRPCCYSSVPLGLYSALNATKKGKEKWKALTPDERRDLVDWIDTSKDKKMEGERIRKVAQSLSMGKNLIK